MSQKIIVISGYFNPVHSGHIAMMREAKMLGDKLIVIVNNDLQVQLKRSVPFMDEKERAHIVGQFKYVDDVVISIDNDRTVCKTLELIKPHIFANGGDRKSETEIPESSVCKELNIEMVFNVGGEKKQSSSNLIKSAVNFFKKTASSNLAG